MGARSHGFTVVELLISAAIVLGIMGVALTVVGQARDALDRDGMGVEAAQRLRAGLDALMRDVRAAGAGPERETASSLLAHSLPAVELLAPVGASSAGGFRALRVTSAPRGAAHGRLAEPFAGGSLLMLARPPECAALPVCGFREGATVVVYDGIGVFDVAQVGAIDPVTWSLTIAPPIGRSYAAGTRVAEVVISTLEMEVDEDGAGRLVRRTGNEAVQPVIDHVVAFGVEAFGEALPPMPGAAAESPPTYGPVPPPVDIDDPRDPFGPGENCTMASGGAGVRTARLPALGSDGALVAMDVSMVRDGPWCPGPAGGIYDADLFRLRRVDLRLRVESASDRLRGPAGVLFARGGHGRATSWVQDLELRVSVSPPNLGAR